MPRNHARYGFFSRALALPPRRGGEGMNEQDRAKAYEFFRRWLIRAEILDDQGMLDILKDFQKTFKIPWVWKEREEEAKKT